MVSFLLSASSAPDKLAGGCGSFHEFSQKFIKTKMFLSNILISVNLHILTKRYTLENSQQAQCRRTVEDPIKHV